MAEATIVRLEHFNSNSSCSRVEDFSTTDCWSQHTVQYIFANISAISKSGVLSWLASQSQSLLCCVRRLEVWGVRAWLNHALPPALPPSNFRPSCTTRRDWFHEAISWPLLLERVLCHFFCGSSKMSLMSPPRLVLFTIQAPSLLTEKRLSRMTHRRQN